MFTGIVHNHYPVSEVVREEGLMHLRVTLGSALTEGLEQGASVSVAGVCLTVVGHEGGVVTFDVIGETLARTTLGALESGARVNIERAARLGDEVGGHDVSGHVSGVGVVTAIEAPTNNRVVRITVDPEVMRYVFHKGYIALDGASLTVAALDRPAHTLDVHLIPETLTRTTFGARQVGDRINVEVDPRTVAIVDTVDAVLNARLEAMLVERLASQAKSS
ncbi:MAG: riboflavin synthase subunit alpha [Myxococcota bacterium]